MDNNRGKKEREREIDRWRERERERARERDGRSSTSMTVCVVRSVGCPEVSAPAAGEGSIGTHGDTGSGLYCFHTAGEPLVHLLEENGG
jgi:hypothetical protein